MAGVNKVILVGNLGKNPEVRTLNDNTTKVASFSLATSESYKDRTTGEKKTVAEWHNVTLWKGLAEIAEKYLKKGSQVYIEGKLKTRSWEKDGVTRYTTNIIGHNLVMLGQSGGGGGAQGQETSEQAMGYTQPNQAQSPTGETQEDLDDLPF